MAEGEKPNPETKEESTAADEAAFMDGLFLEEHEGPSDGAEEDEGADGLGLDDQQAEEIRQIFLTTLPQYLEPVEQMLDELFEGGGDFEEAVRGISNTLASIAEAASRIGVEDVRLMIAEMIELLERIEDLEDPTALAVESKLRSKLEEIAVVSRGEALDVATETKTILAALDETGQKGEVPAAVLQKLTAAGVVTVEQLEMGRLDELMAVTGLDAETVASLVKRITGKEPRGSKARKASPASDREAKAASPDLEELGSRARKEAEAEIGAEADLAAERAALRTLRMREAELRPLLGAERRERKNLEAELRRKRAELGDDLVALDRLRGAGDTLSRERAALLRDLDRHQSRVEALTEDERSAQAELERFEQSVRGMVARVQALLDPPDEANED